MSAWKQYRPMGWWLVLVSLSTLVFWLTDLDLWVARFFYTPAKGAKPWLLDDYPLWKALFYDGVPYLACVVIVSCLLIILVSILRKRYYRWRLYAGYIVLVFLLGPGLLVNSLFKDHWGRARPVQVEQLGGTQMYTPPLYYVANGDGRSFPSGHSSVGFAFIAFWFLWRERKPQWALAALILTLLFGITIGLTRMAAGGHFLSDVLWSAWLPFFSAWVIYYKILCINKQEYTLNSIE